MTTRIATLPGEHYFSFSSASTCVLAHRSSCTAIIRIVSALAAFLAATFSASAQTTWDHQTYKFLNVNSGKALDVEGYSLDLGADLQQWTDGGTTNQKWYFMNVGNSTGPGRYMALGNVNSGYVLDVRDYPTYNVDGQAIQQWWKHGYPTVANEQMWLNDFGGGRYNIIAGNSGKYLRVDGASTSNGAIIVQYASNGSNAEKWDLVHGLTYMEHAFVHPIILEYR